jgi:hypothetical protein
MDKRIKNTLPGLLCILMMISFLVPAQLSAQEKKKKKTRYRLSLNYQKISSGDKIITARLFYKEGPKFFNVAGETVSFFIMGEEDETPLADIVTNENGNAILQIENGYPLPWDEDGMCIFGARFEGNENARSADGELYITDVDIDFAFTEEEEERYVNVIVTKNDTEGTKVPVYEAEVYGYVERMFSLLPIGEDYSDEEGKLTFEFPKKLPGDSIGNLIVVVRINESDEFGTVEMKKPVRWGLPRDFSESRQPRGLWTDEAPVWMSMAVLIILAGAWLNFFMAIYRVYQMKKRGQQTEADTPTA